MIWPQSSIEPAATNPQDVVAIVGIVAGVVGTLAGAALGAWVTWKIQQRQLEHEDRTRFHDRRLATYADFNDACAGVFAARSIGREPKDVGRVTVAYATLNLIASRSVYDLAARVHEVVAKLATMEVEAETVKKDYFGRMNALRDAMREELGMSASALAPPRLPRPWWWYWGG